MTKKIQAATEDQVHTATLNLLRLKLNGAVINHARNEGNRSGKRGVLDGARGKRLGVTAGYPDLCVHWRGVTFFVEIKREGSYLSPSQRAIKARLETQGFRYFVSRSVLDAEEIVKDMKVEIRSLGR